MRRLLVISDKSAGKQLALLHALEVARVTGAAIELVGFIHAAGVDSSEILTHEEKRKIHNSYVDKKQAELDGFIKSIDVSGVDLSSDVVWEKSLEKWVVARCGQKSFDMVFKSGTRKDSFTYTSTDWQLMRNCPEAIMIVADNPWKEGGVILAALDLGSTNERNLILNEDIMRNAIKLGKATNSDVHACYSLSIPKALVDLDLINPVAYEKRARDHLDPILKILMDEAGLDPDKLHIFNSKSKPAKGICRIAKKVAADAIVLGCKSQHSLRGRLMGNTAEKILNKTTADVVVIK